MDMRGHDRSWPILTGRQRHRDSLSSVAAAYNGNAVGEVACRVQGPCESLALKGLCDFVRDGRIAVVEDLDSTELRQHGSVAR